MTTDTTAKAKRGPKPIGEVSMSAAERMRRSRERKHASGVKKFEFQVEGMHLDYVEQLAQHNNVSVSSALRMLLEPSLDRYVGVMRRCERMKENGATDAQIDIFVHTHFMPELPPMPEINGQ